MFLFPANAAELPGLISAREGLFSESPLLRPGKVDVLYKSRPDFDQFNAFVWTPLIKGGGGVIDPETGDATRYGGGFFRPFHLR